MGISLDSKYSSYSTADIPFPARSVPKLNFSLYVQVNIPEEHLNWPLLIGIQRNHTTGQRPGACFTIRFVLTQNCKKCFIGWWQTLEVFHKLKTYLFGNKG